MKFRSRNEIIFTILSSTGNGNSMTRIMHDACLTYVQVMQYLSALERNKMIERNEGSRIYRVTRKGKRILDACMSNEERHGSSTGKILEKLY